MHRRGLNPSRLEITLPEEPMQFNPAHTIDARDVFRAAAAPAKPLLQQLFDLPASAELAAAISELALAEEKARAYISRALGARAQDLDLQRDEQRELCRQAEDEFKLVRIELNQIRERLNYHAGQLNLATAAMADASIPPYDTAYPSDAERADWILKRDAAKIVLQREQQLHQDLAQEELRCVYRFESASKALAEADEKLKLIDRELRELH